MTDPEALPATALDAVELDRLLTVVQDGVVSRRQLLDLGAKDHDIARMVRRRELVVAHPGVYVAHTGPLTWPQRAWVAVLACWPAALCGESALPVPVQTGPIHIAVDHRRTARPPAGVVVHRMVALDERVLWLASPPRLRFEHAALDVAAGKGSVFARFRVLADSCQTRKTTAALIRQALEGRPRYAGRRLVLELLDDLETGACSVLEHEYLELERRHGLPTADRQQRDRAGGRTVYRDVPYPLHRVRVELDGRAFHDTAAARDRDAERDLDGRVLDDAVTVRLTYGQVFDRGCETIAKVAVLLRRGGWAGQLTRCPRCP